MPALSRHNTEMFQCPQCDKSYSRKSHLLRHELTHTSELSASCPICKKEFQKPEVARRHSKQCAKKHNQPIPPAARAGRKKMSCDSCFDAKTACDRSSIPCGRCTGLGVRCSLDELTPSLSTTRSMVTTTTTTTSKQGLMSNEPFYFLLHFTDPAVKNDRLAISETAGCSMRRNLAVNTFSSLENSTPLDFFIDDLIVEPGLLSLGDSVAEDDYFQIDEFISDAVLPSKLPRQLHDIASELAETSRSMSLDTGSEHTMLKTTVLDALFTVENLTVFITAFFHSLHWHMPVVHCPTFDPANISNSLLLAIFLAGAVYTIPFQSADLVLPPSLLSVAEEYVFRKVANLSATTTPSDQPVRGYAIETVQAALILEMLQFSQGDPLIRRRIRIVRHPCLVSTIRSMGLFRYKRRQAPGVSDEDKWRELAVEEVCIRVACWTFLADGFLTVCFKNHPQLTILEMDCDFPWSTELFEAESVSSFNEMAAAQTTGPSLPTLRKVAESLLQMPSSGNRISWDRSLSVEHLLMLIYAMNSLAFQARSGLLGFISIDTIKHAAMNWRTLWKSVSHHFHFAATTTTHTTTTEQNLHLGYPKHAEELWWLLMTTLDAAANNSGRNGKKFQYLDSNATDDLGKLNEFIQFARPRVV
uniref:Gastrula zinc finger protein XlCGF9.1 n=2 Tax=Talaromyces marneffei PM1 TaxID=1077442 RepID=A0A093XLP8_TALMA